MKTKVALILVFAGAALVLSGCDAGVATNQGANSPASNTSTAQGVTANVPVGLVGTWRTECLVPDLGSNYAELHQFIIAADGAAQHKRWMYENHTCQGEGVMNTDPYEFQFPGGNVVNQVSDGQAIFFDIYDLTAGTLLFGHGFRNNLTYAENTLNEYIRYSQTSPNTNIEQ